MGLPPLPLSPIRLVPRAPRAPFIGTIAISLGIHGGLVAVALAGDGRWVATPTPSAPTSPTVTVPVALVGFKPAAPPSSNDDMATRARSRHPDIPPAPRLEPARFSVLREPGPAATIAISELGPTPPFAESDGLVRAVEAGASGPRLRDPAPHADHGPARAAELRGDPSERAPSCDGRVPGTATGIRWPSLWHSSSIPSAGSIGRRCESYRLPAVRTCTRASFLTSIPSARARESIGVFRPKPRHTVPSWPMMS